MFLPFSQMSAKMWSSYCWVGRHDWNGIVV